MKEPGKEPKTFTFPDDENGDVLRRLRDQGDDLSRPRDIEFTVVFPNEVSAQKFVSHIHALGYVASIERTETVSKHPWDVVVVKHMQPAHAAIGEFEDLLQNVASPLGGRNNGWGCFTST